MNFVDDMNCRVVNVQMVLSLAITVYDDTKFSLSNLNCLFDLKKMKGALFAVRSMGHVELF